MPSPSSLNRSLSASICFLQGSSRKQTVSLLFVTCWDGDSKLDTSSLRKETKCVLFSPLPRGSAPGSLSTGMADRLEKEVAVWRLGGEEGGTGWDEPKPPSPGCPHARICVSPLRKLQGKQERRQPACIGAVRQAPLLLPAPGPRLPPGRQALPDCYHTPVQGNTMS